MVEDDEGHAFLFSLFFCLPEKSLIYLYFTLRTPANNLFKFSRLIRHKGSLDEQKLIENLVFANFSSRCCRKPPQSDMNQYWSLK